MEQNKGNNPKKIVVVKNGPYKVFGNIPLVRKEQVVSEYGEPIAWKKVHVFETGEYYELCRCGMSSMKPFCDRTHELIDFDGRERAPISLTSRRQVIYEGGTKIIVKRDKLVCMEAGFCANRFEDIEAMVARSDDTRVRSLIIAMIERCPSGSYTYALQEGGADVEPDLPEQIAVVMEMTSDGPIMGPLWVTGNIPIERSDGRPFEVRNRVTLCRCGLSEIKPLCDGKHRELNVKE